MCHSGRYVLRMFAFHIGQAYSGTLSRQQRGQMLVHSLRACVHVSADSMSLLWKFK